MHVCLRVNKRKTECACECLGVSCRFMSCHIVSCRIISRRAMSRVIIC